MKKSDGYKRFSGLLHHGTTLDIFLRKISRSVASTSFNVIVTKERLEAEIETLKDILKMKDKELFQCTEIMNEFFAQHSAYSAFVESTLIRPRMLRNFLCRLQMRSRGLRIHGSGYYRRALDVEVNNLYHCARLIRVFHELEDIYGIEVIKISDPDMKKLLLDTAHLMGKLKRYYQEIVRISWHTCELLYQMINLIEK